MRTVKRKPITKASNSTGPERRLARAINQGWNIMDAGAMTEYARDRVARGDIEGFIDALPWADLQDHLTTEAVPAMIEPAAKAARIEVGQVMAAGAFNHVDDLSLRYAQQQAGTLIVAISNTQRDTIRQILGTAMKGDLTKDGAARRIRQVIGLDPRKAQAVVNYEARLMKRVPKGYSPARWEQAVAKKTRIYHDRLLRRRSDMIARTEIITAENLGKYATWTDSIARGINGADSRKEWSPGPGACEQCAAMAGETVRWDAAFSNGNLMPPAHPNCRCTAQLLPAPYKNPALNPRPINWTDPLGHRHTIDTDQFGQGRRLLQEPPAPKAPGRISDADAAAGTIQTVADAHRAIPMSAGNDLYEYTNYGYKDFNQALRTGQELTGKYKTMAQSMDKALDAQAPLAQDIMVYRGMRIADLGDPVGKTITDRAFISTSVRRDVAERFTDNGKALVEIRVPAGNKALSPNIAPFGKGDPMLRDMIDSLEGELILPRGMSIQITGQYVDDTGRTILKAELRADLPEPPKLPKPHTDADDLTYDSTLHWSDEKLADRIGYYAEKGDDAALDKILEIIDQRAEAEAAQAAKYAAEAAARQQLEAAAARAKAIEDAKYAEQARRSQESYEAAIRAIQAEKEAEAVNAAKSAGLIKPDPSPVRNPAARPERQLTAKEQAGEQYQEYLNTQMAKALDDLNGVFFNRANHAEARARGFTEETLFTAPWQVANKYASDELKDWWLTNGRESLKSYRYKITQNQSDKWAADAVRKRGHETGQAKRDRSIF